MLIASVLGNIKALLQSAKIVEARDGAILISESSRTARLRGVCIDSVGSTAFAIRFDQCGFPGNKLFADHATMHRACDAIVFCSLGETAYILCCELKSSLPDRKEARDQFFSAACFLDCLECILSQYSQGNSIKTWKRRYFVFHDQGATPMQKRTSVKTKINDLPETAEMRATQDNGKFYLRALVNEAI